MQLTNRSVVVSHKEQSFAEKIYFPALVKGMVITFSHLFKKRPTIMYPEKKRDIAPQFIKLNFLFNVIFLFAGYFFSGFVKQDFSNYSMERIIETVIVAALWTYYINTSNRVKQTFVVPYPN